jgi:hypothetical protein
MKNSLSCLVLIFVFITYAEAQSQVRKLIISNLSLIDRLRIRIHCKDGRLILSRMPRVVHAGHRTYRAIP